MRVPQWVHACATVSWIILLGHRPKHSSNLAHGDEASLVPLLLVAPICYNSARQLCLYTL